MNDKFCCYEIEILDVAHKWMDNTKTTTELVYYNEIGQRSVLAYVHSDNTKEEVKEHINEYIDVLLSTIKKNIIM